MKKAYCILLSSLSLLSSLQGAPYTGEEKSTSHRVMIEKKLSKSEVLARQKERKQIADAQKAQARKVTGLSSHPTAMNKAPGCFYSQKPLYRIKSIGASGKTLSFDNETIWEISDSSASTARGWMPGSYVLIIPNTSWFSSHTYRLENACDGTSVSANLSEGPFMKYATFISYIDPMTRTIHLTDNSLWAIGSDSHSQNLFRWCQNGQAILIGENRGWFGWPNGNILININENDYMTAQRAN